MLSPDTGAFIQQHAGIDPVPVSIGGSERASVEIHWRIQGRRVPGTPPPPLLVQLISFSCSFQQPLTPPDVWEILDPPLGSI